MKIFESVALLESKKKPLGRKKKNLLLLQSLIYMELYPTKKEMHTVEFCVFLVLDQIFQLFHYYGSVARLSPLKII